jgi:hypothetical protein
MREDFKHAKDSELGRFCLLEAKVKGIISLRYAAND